MFYNANRKVIRLLKWTALCYSHCQLPTVGEVSVLMGLIPYRVAPDWATETRLDLTRILTIEARPRLIIQRGFIKNRLKRYFYIRSKNMEALLRTDSLLAIICNITNIVVDLVKLVHYAIGLCKRYKIRKLIDANQNQLQH